MNVLLFIFHCNVFIGVRIIKEMPNSVESGTQCMYNACLVQEGLKDLNNMMET